MLTYFDLFYLDNQMFGIKMNAESNKFNPEEF